MQDSIKSLTNEQYKVFKRAFDDKKNNKNLIAFTDFLNLMKNVKKFNQDRVSQITEPLKKELKNKNSTDNEANILINEADYFKYVAQLVNDHNKDANENDDEMKKLFEDLCGKNESLNQKFLVEQFEKYGIEIDTNEFFRLVKGKDPLYFEDFCLLFKSKEQQDMFKRTFGNGFFNPNDPNAPKLKPTGIDEDEDELTIYGNFPIKPSAV